MSAYLTLTSPTVSADPLLLSAAARVSVSDVVVFRLGSHPTNASLSLWRCKSPSRSSFTAGEQAALQTAIDTAVPWSLRACAQACVDTWPLDIKALALALLDQINVLRTQAGLQVVTVPVALAAIRTKAGQL